MMMKAVVFVAVLLGCLEVEAGLGSSSREEIQSNIRKFTCKKCEVSIGAMQKVAALVAGGLPDSKVVSLVKGICQELPCDEAKTKCLTWADALGDDVGKRVNAGPPEQICQDMGACRNSTLTLQDIAEQMGEAINSTCSVCEKVVGAAQLLIELYPIDDYQVWQFGKAVCRKVRNPLEQAVCLAVVMKSGDKLVEKLESESAEEVCAFLRITN